jgi:D-alanine-D-alanine ligase-like ATP-grasp enzyme
MIRVGVLRGGPRHSFESSLENGGAVLSVLRSEPYSSVYEPVDILLDEGLWHVRGVPVSMEQLAQVVDVVFNTLGNDTASAQFSHLLSAWSIPHTGSNPASSYLAHDLVQTRTELKNLGLKTPQHLFFEAYLSDIDGPSETYPMEKAKEVFFKMAPPWVARPFTRGSSMGIHVCKTLPELVRAFEVAMQEKVSVLVEELIEGKPAAISVLENYRGLNTYPFLCEGAFSSEEKRECERLAALIHNDMHLDHYSQSHFVVNPKKGIYVMEVHTIPDLSASSVLHDHLASVGASTPEFINHMITLALGGRS